MALGVVLCLKTFCNQSIKNLRTSTTLYKYTLCSFLAKTKNKNHIKTECTVLSVSLQSLFDELLEFLDPALLGERRHGRRPRLVSRRSLLNRDVVAELVLKHGLLAAPHALHVQQLGQLGGPGVWTTQWQRVTDT